MIATGTIGPTVNQVQFSALSYRKALLDACQQQNVVAEAYSPLGTGRNLSNPTVARVAQQAGRAPAQVLLRCCLQHDVPVISKSVHWERLMENAQIFDFTLSAGDMAELDALDQTHGTDQALEHKRLVLSNLRSPPADLFQVAPCLPAGGVRSEADGY